MCKACRSMVDKRLTRGPPVSIGFAETQLARNGVPPNRFFAQILVRIPYVGRRATRRGEAIRRGVGKAKLTRHRSALVAVLACASLFAATIAAEAATKRGAGKSSSATTAKVH